VLNNITQTATTAATTAEDTQTATTAATTAEDTTTATTAEDTTTATTAEDTTTATTARDTTTEITAEDTNPIFFIYKNYNSFLYITNLFKKDKKTQMTSYPLITSEEIK
jgi:hypothetical protein